MANWIQLIQSSQHVSPGRPSPERVFRGKKGQKLNRRGSKIASWNVSYRLLMAELAQSVSFNGRTIPPTRKQSVMWRVGILLALMAWLYAPILLRLSRQWWADPNFSHGFFVPLFSAF